MLSHGCRGSARLLLSRRTLGRATIETPQEGSNRGQSDSTRQLVDGLGLFSLGLGAAQLLAPGAMNRLVRVNDHATSRAVMRWLGGAGNSRRVLGSSRGAGPTCGCGLGWWGTCLTAACSEPCWPAPGAALSGATGSWRICSPLSRWAVADHAGGQAYRRVPSSPMDTRNDYVVALARAGNNAQVVVAMRETVPSPPRGGRDDRSSLGNILWHI